MITPVSPHSSIAPRIVTATTTISIGPVTMPVTPSSARIASEKNVPSV